MTQPFSSRMTARFDGDFVVMLLGMRINRPWKLHKWLPVFMAMPKMLKELQKHPESGYLGHEMYLGLVIVYWRSFDQLEAYARNKNMAHLPAWVKFRKSGGSESGDVGLWHELYLVTENSYESIYTGMPTTGIGHFGNLNPAKGSIETSRGRIENRVVN